MDLSHISQDKILPEVDLVSHEDDKSKIYLMHPSHVSICIVTAQKLFSQKIVSDLAHAI